MALRLNLGCGNHKLDGFLNADSQPACHPDQVVNLESTPWPWEDNSVDEIFMSHGLEHLSANTDIYLGLYLGVNFELEETKVNILEPWDSQINSGSMSKDDVRPAVNCFYNVIGDTTFVLRVVN